MADRYTRAVLTVIAAALVYLCILQTPLPSVAAQGAQRPGEPTPPLEVIVVGWRPGVEGIPVSVVSGVRVEGVVQTEQRPNATDRVALVGWEEQTPDSQRRQHVIGSEAGLPVTVR